MALTTLKSIDVEALKNLAEKGKQNPESVFTLKASTECQGQFLNAVTIRNLAPVMIDEPPRLLGTDTAPNPSEIVLAGLGACLSVGLMANATYRGIKLTEIRIELEGDINGSAVWGCGNTAEGNNPGISDIRVKVSLKGDATEEELDDIKRHALKWSPVANTLRNPVRIAMESLS